MASSSRFIDTDLSKSNIDQSSMTTHLSREQKPEPHDYYMYLLRAEQGRDKDTRRSTLLSQRPTNNKTITFEPFSYDKFWDGDSLTNLKANPSPNLIFQVLPIPSQSPHREKKLVLGFNFSTNELTGYTLEPTEIIIEEMYKQPDIWRECRDIHALLKSWPHRNKVISISTTRFYEMINFTMEYFDKFGANMVRDGILHFFKESSHHLHPSLDLVVVIQFAQFLSDFVHVLEDDWEQGRALVEKYDACQEFLRNLLLRASVDAWMTSYELLKGGMNGKRKKDIVPQETRDEIQILVQNKVDQRNHQQLYFQVDEADDEQYTAMQYIQQVVQDTTTWLNDIYAVPGVDGRGQPIWRVGSGLQYRLDTYLTAEWFWHPWVLLTTILSICIWLLQNQMYLHMVTFLVCFFFLCFGVTTGGEDSRSLLTLLAEALRLPTIQAWISKFVVRWDLWYSDVLAAAAALQLLALGEYTLLLEEVLGWVTLGLDCTVVLSSVYFIYTNNYTSLARGVLLWFFLRLLIPELEYLKDLISEYVSLYLKKYVSILYLPYGLFVLWAITQREWKLLLSGLFFMFAVHWTASRIWKLAKNGYEAKAFLIWTFIAWRTLRAGTYILECEANYFALAIFARWMSRVGMEEGYHFLFFWFGLVLLWRAWVTRIEPVKIPIDILVIFCLDWFSVAVIEPYVTAAKKQLSNMSPWNEHLGNIYNTPTSRRAAGWGQDSELAD